MMLIRELSDVDSGVVCHHFANVMCDVFVSCWFCCVSLQCLSWSMEKKGGGRLNVLFVGVHIYFFKKETTKIHLLV